ncbi:RsmB/NOP family class I SAM-dependent RNA methyltransferase [Pelagibius marinus]|uniref:RsmB/NOP family class I SAM-dependent RNA methyltransferase n=1 Tax=Pelagibius marinus TaxID=2762760 RepID=UPI001872AABD|nr:RsmB/NOP family class I SAM-dependent RNA methyltransferase [Pelagibius marinus]
MMPAARLQATIEILDGITGEGAGEGAVRPAERVVNDYLRQRRYIGSKDRRAVTALTYDVLRHHARLAWWLQRGRGSAAASRQQLLAYLLLCEHEDPQALNRLFDGSRYAPPPLTTEEAALVERLEEAAREPEQPPAWVANEVPEWIMPRLEAAFGAAAEQEAAALLQEAPVDLRVNTLLGSRADAVAALAEEGIEAAPTPLSPRGLRLGGRRALRATQAFGAGLVELQDEGSQLAALLCDARPGMAVADVCAGGGGKTLALAAEMKGQGRLLAMDAEQARLDRSAIRLKRAGLSEGGGGFVERRAQKNLAAAEDLQGTFDRVLVDAPCSGSGAWRRHPDARWRLTPEALEGYKAAQHDVLRQAAVLVKPGGRLIYVTCSLLPEENQDQVEAFLADAPDFAALPLGEVWAQVLTVPYPGEDPYLTLTPARHGTDGFFVAIFRREEEA